MSVCERHYSFLCVCVFVCRVHTALKGGALGCHAPCAGAAAFGHHDGELIQRVGLQTRHYVAQAGGVGHLERDEEKTHTQKKQKELVCILAD